MKTFTAKVTIPGAKSPHFLRDCAIIEGVIVIIDSVGVGTPITKGGMFNGEGDTWEEYPEYRDAYRITLRKSAITPELAEIVKDKKYFSLDEIRKYKAQMFTLGENEGGYFVEDFDEFQRKEKAEEVRKFQEDKKCRIYDGVFGLRMHDRLPSDVWAKIKSLATYHREEEMEDADDMGFYNAEKKDVIGYSYEAGIIEILTDAGWEVSYYGTVVKNKEGLIEILAKNTKEEKAHKQKEEERNQEIKTLVMQLASFPRTYLTEEEGKTVGRLPEIPFPAFGWQGANIYGGGKWLAKDSDNLYMIYNNGMDGDDWSRNNVVTGGAGAIGYKTPLTKEVEDLLEEMKNFK